MQQQKGNVSITMLRDQYLLPHMIINDENNLILFFKRVFSDVLEGVTSEKFSGGKPPEPTPVFQQYTYKKPLIF